MTGDTSFLDRLFRPLSDGDAGGGVFVIAEGGVNHNGDIASARKMIDVAVEAGADAVKFQFFSTDRLVRPDAATAPYQKAAGATDTQADLLRGLELDAAAHEALAAHAALRGIPFLSTPFDLGSARALVDQGVPLVKISSGDLTNLPFLAAIAAMGRPMILSSGMGTLGECEAAIAAVRDAGLDRVALLHCTSNYPADPAQVNLRAMGTLARAFGIPVGYSDHTMGLTMGIAAAALGARIIEKHFTLDRALPGPDHKASLTPDELAAYVAGIRQVEAALGDGIKTPRPEEAPVAAIARRSIVAARDIARGSVIAAEDLDSLRPADGLSPALTPEIVGGRATRDIPKGAPLAWGDWAWGDRA